MAPNSGTTHRTNLFFYTILATVRLEMTSNLFWDKSTEHLVNSAARKVVNNHRIRSTTRAADQPEKCAKPSHGKLDHGKGTPWLVEEGAPLGAVRGFRRSQILGCYFGAKCGATKFAPHLAPKLIV